MKAKYYDESRKRKETLARAPPSVNHAQFARLVDYWRSDEAKVYLVLFFFERKVYLVLQNYIALFILFGKVIGSINVLNLQSLVLYIFFIFFRDGTYLLKLGQYACRNIVEKIKIIEIKKKTFILVVQNQ